MKKDLQALSLSLLEWPALLEELKAGCISAYGISLWKNLVFYTQKQEAQTHLAEVFTLSTVLQRQGLPTWSEKPLPDCNQTLVHLSKGGRLSLNEVADLHTLTGYIHRWRYFLHENLDFEEPMTPNAFAWWTNCPSLEPVIAVFNDFLEANGTLKLTVSELYAELYTKLKAQRRTLEITAQEMLDNSKFQGFLQEVVISQRNGHYVFPVKAVHKAAVAGLVHGHSSSGGTVFIEPQALLSLRNSVNETEEALQQEVNRLLKVLSSLLEKDCNTIQKALSAWAELDKRMGAAQLAKKLRATVPAFSNSSDSLAFDLIEARHPLLALTLKDKIVSNTFKLGQNNERTLIITGPNTGGKTVFLKTIGLLVFMVKAGIPIPVGQGSSLSWIDEVLADIGDAQDLTHNLSTFSGHIERLQGFVERLQQTPTPKALILLDELCAGTDPVEGTALAKALLSAFYEAGALTLATTHLSDLKLEAHHQPGYVNASVAFDPETLAPSYQLRLRVPGSSHALLIAERLGLNPAIIEKAKGLLDQPQRQSTDWLAELETRRFESEQAQQTALLLKQEWEAKTRLVTEEYEGLLANKKRLLQEFRSGLKNRLQNLEEQTKRLRKSLQTVQIDADSPSKALVERGILGSQFRQLSKDADEAFTELENPLNQATSALPKLHLAMGKAFWCDRLNSRVTVEATSADGQKITVLSGRLRVIVAPHELRNLLSNETLQTKNQAQQQKKQERAKILSKTKALEPEKEASTDAARRLASKLIVSGCECDIRGLRVLEALEQLDKFLDTAVLQGFEAVSVIHGLGTGALKQAVRDHLKQSPYVARFYAEEAVRGGDGKTLIELKT